MLGKSQSTGPWKNWLQDSKRILVHICARSSGGRCESSKILFPLLDREQWDEIQFWNDDVSNRKFYFHLKHWNTGDNFLVKTCLICCSLNLTSRQFMSLERTKRRLPEPRQELPEVANARLVRSCKKNVLDLIYKAWGWRRGDSF